jgi:hypothetical protein
MFNRHANGGLHKRLSGLSPRGGWLIRGEVMLEPETNVFAACPRAVTGVLVTTSFRGL